MAKDQQHEGGAAVLDTPETGSFQLGAKSKRTRDDISTQYWLVDVISADGMSLAEYELWPRIIPAASSYEACDIYRRYYSIISTVHRIEAEEANAAQFAIQKEFDKRTMGTRGKRSDLKAAFAKAADAAG